MEVNIVAWEDEESALRYIRQKVFVEEQQVPEALEWDATDKVALHLLAREDSRPVACARIERDGKLGRLAVLKENRQQGWGARILKAAEAFLLKEKLAKIYLNSQANSYRFYFNKGYRPCDEMFWDAGIPHIRMQKVLNKSNAVSHAYLLGLDEDNHYSSEAAASPVWFQIASKQSRRSIDIWLHDLAHPVFNNASCLENLTAFIRQSKHTQIRVLLNEEYRGLAEHPMMIIQQRLSSRFIVRRADSIEGREVHNNQILFDLKGHMRFDYQTSYCNFNNQLSVGRHKVHFEQAWAKSKPLIEGRKLFI